MDMVRGLLNLLLLLSPVMDMAMVMDMGIILVMDMVDMDIMDITVRGLLKLNPDMGIMAMDMVMDMAMDTMDTMARDLLRLSPDMDIMAMDMDTMDMDMDMVMVMDTMVKQG